MANEQRTGADRSDFVIAYESEYVLAAARFKYQLKAQEPAALQDFDPADVGSGPGGGIDAALMAGSPVTVRALLSLDY
jgi:hypothetical protein